MPDNAAGSQARASGQSSSNAGVPSSNSGQKRVPEDTHDVLQPARKRRMMDGYQIPSTSQPLRPSSPPRRNPSAPKAVKSTGNAARASNPDTRGARSSIASTGQNNASASGSTSSAPMAGNPAPRRVSDESSLNAARKPVPAMLPPQVPRRTLDGYQVPPLATHDPQPRRNPNLPRAVKATSTTANPLRDQAPAAGAGLSGGGVPRIGGIGAGGAGRGSGPGGSSASGNGATSSTSANAGAGAGASAPRRGGPPARFDASKRPQPIHSSLTARINDPTKFPLPIPRRDLQRLQRQEKQAQAAAQKAAGQKAASSPALQLRAAVAQRLPGLFPTPSSIVRNVVDRRPPPTQPSQPTHSPAAATPYKSQPKSAAPYKPLQLVLAEERIEEILRRRKQGNVIRPQRMGATRSGVQTIQFTGPHPSLPIAYLDERARVRIIGEEGEPMDVDEDDDSEIEEENEDEDEEEEEEEDVDIGNQRAKPVRRFSARKRESVPSPSESGSSSESEPESTSSEDTLQYVSPVEEPEDEDDDDDIYMPEEEVNPEVIILDDPRQVQPSTLESSTEPPAEMVAALDALVQPTVKLQHAKRLPFRLRTLRRGFLELCEEMKVPSSSSTRGVSLSVYYAYKDGALYKAKVDAWQCPLCAIMGTMPTRQVLQCHLKWDHPELFYEWRKVPDMEDKESWEVHILIPEITEPGPAPVQDGPREGASSEMLPPATPRQATPFMARATPGPSVITPPIRPTLKEETSEDVKPPFWRSESSSQAPEDRSVTASGQSVAASTSVSASATASASASRPRSTTASTAQPAPRVRSVVDGTLPVVPPPPDDPLGPAARPPYLPAEADYEGGQTVYYSCRPGGACLFDLLGTLPMEPYGILEWEVRDREEEIYESDDVKDEYKVMQALWSRWIMLNRNRFVANYYNGIITFIDQYWKFIHRAAGWAALRYLLFALLANDFLTTHEIAKAIRHYEELTCMALWYTTG